MTVYKKKKERKVCGLKHFLSDRSTLCVCVCVCSHLNKASVVHFNELALCRESRDGFVFAWKLFKEINFLELIFMYIILLFYVLLYSVCHNHKPYTWNQ